ncbi:unnamed protein product [Spirodela intermedia]|uniref:tRNA (guanosine(18)-2'-O)-methyltransferase TARBP1 n=1 Tax=Spirodela intermedia TaxID=51605 RepID=A0A7I8K6A4_SPIIN|nr:unnamed protein product [Spirodela intermedia]
MASAVPDDPIHASPWLSSMAKSLALVPPAAVPAFIDCVLNSAAFPPSELFFSLLRAFTLLTEDIRKDDYSKIEMSQSCSLISYTGALFHLIKNPDVSNEAFEMFIRRAFVPLLSSAAVELLDQLADFLCDAVAARQSWDLMTSTLVPLCLRSVCLSLEITHPNELSIYQWGSIEFIEPGSLSLTVASRILSSLIGVALRGRGHSERTTSQKMELVGGIKSSDAFAQNLTWDLSLTVVDMLLQSSECRSEAIRLLFPVIFRTAQLLPSFEVLANGKTHSFSRAHFFRNVWQRCIAMFLLGKQERADAYNLISLYLSLLSVEGHVDNVDGDYNIREDDKFWEEIRKGLVDKDTSVRKHSLYILKKLLRDSCNRGLDCTQSSADSDPIAKSLVMAMPPEDIVSRSGVSRRGKWADKEAKSMGVGEVCGLNVNGLDKWNAFLLLYEMLEEYGTHLVEAAWTHQISLFFQSGSCENITDIGTKRVYQNQMQTLDEMFNWLAILWERGLFHENPQVRCLIMDSFLGMDWKSHRHYAKYVPKGFVLGPFILGLNDTVHHKGFGLGGHYTSKAIQGAKNFIHQYSVDFVRSERVAFVYSLASLARQESFGRPGLMAFASCLSSAALGTEGQQLSEVSEMEKELDHGGLINCRSSELLDILGVIVERSKQHFNPNYRLQVCERVMEAASAMLCAQDLPLEMVLHFISTLPREFTDFGGTLRRKVQQWLHHGNSGYSSNFSDCGILRDLVDFPAIFIKHEVELDVYISFDDEDLDAWFAEVQRWVRLLFLMVTGDQNLEPVCQVIRDVGSVICENKAFPDLFPPKFLVLVICLVEELQILLKKWKCYCGSSSKIGISAPDIPSLLPTAEGIFSFRRLTNTFLLILEDLMSFSNSVCSIFWSDPVVKNIDLPSSTKGKLGGPSPRRLPLHITSSVLQAILSVKAVASVLSWTMQLGKDLCINSSFTSLWGFCCKVILFRTNASEIGSEIHLAAYESLGSVLKALSTLFSPSALDSVMVFNRSLFRVEQNEFLLDPFLHNFLQSINDLLDKGSLTRSRRSILMKWKWLCLDSLLSIPYNESESGFHPCTAYSFFSDSTLRMTFDDIVESLVNAGETSVLPLLRCARSIIGLLHGRMYSPAAVRNGIDAKMMMDLVESSWILHLSCNKRRIAPIAALLSSVLHPLVFSDLSMHEMSGGDPGPLKWFIEKILDEGTKSPRTMRLAALHLTGLWFSYPKTVKYYIKELTLLSLYGSVAFDEDFAAELSENQEAVFEVSMLAKVPHAELAEVFINTEMYARAAVAVLFDKLANLGQNFGNKKDNDDAFHAGKMFLLDLLDSAVTDKDLAKELYKKYSAIHRRKVRAWQMICVLSGFIDQDIVNEVSSKMHVCLYRNNLPSVRQYLETFAIQIYLKFPSLVEEQLLPIFHDYDVRPQVLSSYVFIAANIILHASEVSVQLKHLNALLPPVIPLLTSHHHSLRGFSQFLVYKVLSKLVPILESDHHQVVAIEKKCLDELKLYLAGNVDCVRLRASMGGILDSFDPSPIGVFNPRNEGSQFECVPITLMEQVITFLNDVRDDLRHSMAKDATTIKNESLVVGDNNVTMEEVRDCNLQVSFSHLSVDSQKHFQKKITLPEVHNQPLEFEASGFSGHQDFPRILAEIEKEDQLFCSALQSRNREVRRLRGSQQTFILVASLIDRIPNLAGLARTCEVFKAAGLAIADVSIVQDKQFQLISVTADKWVPIVEVPVGSMKAFLNKKKHEGFSILGLEQTTNSTPIDQFSFPKKTVLVLGHEKEGIPVDVIHCLDACLEIPQLGVVRSLNVHVSGAIALWEYTRQHRSKRS